jgi:hypothetical protein
MILAVERGKRILCEPANADAAAQGCYFAPAERDLTYAEMGRMMAAALGRCRTCVVRMGPILVWAFGLIATFLSQLRGQAWYFNLDKAREAQAGLLDLFRRCSGTRFGVCRDRFLGGEVETDGPLVSRTWLVCCEGPGERSLRFL